MLFSSTSLLVKSCSFWKWKQAACNSLLEGHLRVHVHLSRLGRLRVFSVHRTLCLKPVISQEDPSAQKNVFSHSSESCCEPGNQNLLSKASFFCLRKLIFYSVRYQETPWWLGFASDRSLPGLILQFSQREKLLAPPVRNKSQSTFALHQLSCSEKSNYAPNSLLKAVFSQEDPVCPVCVFTFWFGN